MAYESLGLCSEDRDWRGMADGGTCYRWLRFDYVLCEHSALPAELTARFASHPHKGPTRQLPFRASLGWSSTSLS